MHSSNLTLFKFYTLSILHSSKVTLFQFYTLPILHSSNPALFQFHTLTFTFGRGDGDTRVGKYFFF